VHRANQLRQNITKRTGIRRIKRYHFLHHFDSYSRSPSHIVYLKNLPDDIQSEEESSPMICLEQNQQLQRESSESMKVFEFKKMS